jgi:hypothetical protein
MSLFASGFSRVITVVCLLATIACSLVAFFTDMNEFVFAAMVFAVIPVLLSYSHQRDRPSDREVQGYLQRLLRARFGGDAFSIRSLRPGMFSILYGRRGYIPFRAQVVLTEPLFERVNVPWASLGGLSPRRLETMRKQVAALVESLGGEASVLQEEMPPDPFSVCFVSEKVAKGTALSLTGAVTATPEPDGWAYTLEFLNHGRKPLEVLGRPQAGFGQPVVLGTRSGESWMEGTVAAWQEFSRKLAALQQRVEVARADRGEWAVESFFRAVKAGSVFHGVGQSVSGQHPATHFFLEVRSTDLSARAAAFTLRNEGSWENARRFHATVSYDVAEKAVWLHGVTERGDSCREGGPLVGAANGFAADFHFVAGPPARLASFGGDVSMPLEEISRAALRELRTSVYGRKRKALDLSWAGVPFVGRLGTDAGDAPVTLLLLEPSSGGRMVEAKIESAGCSGVFLVQEINNPYAADDGDVVLLPAGANSSPAHGPATIVDAWRRVLLTIVEDGFEGRIETAHGVSEVALRRQEAGARSEGE